MKFGRLASLGLMVMAAAMAAVSAAGQSVDLAANLGTVAGSDLSGALWAGGSITEMMPKHWGVNVEFTGRDTAKPIANMLAYRYYLLDVNAVLRPFDTTARLQPEFLIGGGTAFSSVAKPPPVQDPVIVPTTIAERMLHLGGGLTAYVAPHVFLRFETHFYWTHNLETPWRFAISAGYTFGGAQK